MSIIDPNARYLITCNNWFYAPDGHTYKAVWGRVVQVESDKMLGVKTNARSANWYLVVGDTKRGVVIAGCQVHYATACPEIPETKCTYSWATDAANGLKEFATHSHIWIAEEQP